MNYDLIKRPFDESYWVNLIRKINTFFLPIYVRLGITPNMITFLSFVFYVFSAFLFIVHDYYSNLFGSFLAFFAFSLDTVDGDLARFSGKSTIFGKWLDSVVDAFGPFILFIGIFIGLIKNNDFSLVIFVVSLLSFFGYIVYRYIAAIDLIIKHTSNFRRQIIGYEHLKGEHKAVKVTLPFINKSVPYDGFIILLALIFFSFINRIYWFMIFNLIFSFMFIIIYFIKKLF